MRRAEATIAGADALAPATTSLVGWGGGEAVSASVVRPSGTAELRAALELAGAGNGVLPRGLGRSYGDAAQLSGGLVIDTSGLKELELDADGGSVTAQAGVTIGELLGVVLPAGWMLPVVPGTQHVTVGGAIASDIHGKNHGLAQTFGTHVQEISLLRSDGELVDLGPGGDDGLFETTLGGMGLTGIVAAARIKLRPARGAMLSVDTDRVDSLDDALAALSAPGGEYRVAWLDLLGSRPGRGVVTRAALSDAPGDGSPLVHARAAIPRGWPAGVLRPTTVRAFNALKYASAPRRARGRLEGYGRHMFPLDSLDAWPRLYGQQGFLQYQLVVPTGAERVLELVIEQMRQARVPCYLAVLKDFGPANGAPLSFPIEGWTLALDLPRATVALDSMLEGFDDAVAEAGGRVYLSKDARLRPDALSAMYPRLEEWRQARDRADPERVWCSDLALRTSLL